MTESTLEQFLNHDLVSAKLTTAGMTTAVSTQKAGLFADAAQRLSAEGVSTHQRAVACFVPGRIEVLGKHTDYAGGRSLLVAAERGFCAVGVPRDDGKVVMIDVGSNQQAEIKMEPNASAQPSHWSNYPATVVQRMVQNFSGTYQGVTLAFSSDLPRAAGMSSSSALVVMTFMMLARINRLESHATYRQNLPNPTDLAGYLGAVENGISFGSLCGDRGVGTFGGSEDHTAILCSQVAQMVQFSFCPVRRERVISMPSDYVFAIGSSGIVAEKTGAAMKKYNQVSLLARAATELWRQSTGRNDPHLAAAIASSEDAPERLAQILREQQHPDFRADQLLGRFHQFLEESTEIIPAVPKDFTQDNLQSFGHLVDRSQALGARLLQNQTPETVFLAERARHHGATAASAFGAGFGGSVWALVSQQHAERLLEQWRSDYATAFPSYRSSASFFLTHAGPAAMFV